MATAGRGKGTLVVGLARLPLAVLIFQPFRPLELHLGENFVKSWQNDLCVVLFWFRVTFGKGV
jgi:hypothetical protein